MLNVLFSNYSIIFYVIMAILFLITFFSLYEGKDKIELDTNKNSDTAYSSDERMFLHYAKIGKRLVPKEGTPEYNKAAELLFTSKKGTYRQVDIFYGAKIYYAIVGFVVGLIIGLLPIIYNFLISKFLPDAIPLNFPIVISFILPFVGLLLYKYPEMEINSEISKKQKKLQKEILSLGILVHSMLETGNSPYEILSVVKEIKPEFKDDIDKTLNEYYIDTSQALKNLKKRIGIVDFDMIADSLLWAHESDNTFACEFLDDYLNRLEQSQKVSFQKSSKIRPYFLLAASTLPMAGALVIWFYPWISEAASMLGSGFGL